METLNYLWDVNHPLGYNNRIGVYKTKIELEFIQRYINESSKILDVGGGSGRLASSLHFNGSQVTILDINSHAVSIAKKRGLNAHCQSLSEYKSAKLFDVLLSIEMLENINNKNEFFIKVNENLRINGFFVFTILNPKSWRFKIRNLRKGKTNYFYISYEEISKLAVNTGFELIDKKGFMWMPFRVNSNNPLISVFIFIERILKLNNYIFQSPWILIALKKKDEHTY
jgi:2-polyprenyl-3-methyl-5-hydroxy-6-metoxy-1,4-benzoquinol methylase